MKSHETTFYNYLKQKDFPVLDFKYLRKYARMSSYCISENRIALSGDAFAFIDPVYSGGLDTICVCNTMITNVIAKDIQGIDITKYITFYNQLLKDYLSVWSACLNNMYENKDNWYYIFLKYMADTAMYFGAICPFVMNNALRDLDQSQQLWSIVRQIFEIYNETLTFVNDKNLIQHNITERLNLTHALFAAISSNVLAPSDDLEELKILLNDNLLVMKKIYEYVSQDKNLLDLYSPKNYEETKDWTEWRYSSFFDKVS